MTRGYSLSGVARPLPSSGWKVLYEEAFTRFIAVPQHLDAAGAVSDWIVNCRKNGPPAHAVDAGENFYLASVPGTDLTVEYLIVEDEYLIILKDIL